MCIHRGACIAGGYRDDDDEMLQLAIQQSLVDGNSEQDVTLLEALGYNGRNDAQRYGNSPYYDHIISTYFRRKKLVLKRYFI